MINFSLHVFIQNYLDIYINKLICIIFEVIDLYAIDFPPNIWPEFLVW